MDHNDYMEDSDLNIANKPSEKTRVRINFLRNYLKKNIYSDHERMKDHRRLN